MRPVGRLSDITVTGTDQTDSCVNVDQLVSIESIDTIIWPERALRFLSLSPEFVRGIFSCVKCDRLA